MENTIAKQNDEFRSRLGIPHFGDPGIRGTFLFTNGISALPPEVQIDIWSLVRDYSDFDLDNDPYKEHDFGSISHPSAGKIFWKIDYYNPTMTAGSEDPSDPKQTHRVLTVMLASEY